MTQAKFRLERDYLIIVTGSILDSPPLRLLLDTGASTTTLDDQVVSQLGLVSKTIRSMDLAGEEQESGEVLVPGLALDSTTLRFGPFSALVADLSRLDSLVRLDGILGLDLLGQCVLSIDYSDRTVTFESVYLRAEDGPSRPDIAYLLLPIEIGDTSMELILDTASYGMLLYRRQALPGRMIGQTSLEIFGRKYPAQRFKTRQARLGTRPLGNLSASVIGVEPPQPLKVDGIVGPKALGISFLRIDFQNGRIEYDGTEADSKPGLQQVALHTVHFPELLGQ